MSSQLGFDYRIPNIVVIGVPNKEALERVSAKLLQHKIRHYNYSEPDYQMGFTAIATVPLSVEEKKVLSNYRLWKTAEDRGNRIAPSVGTPPPDSRVAQLQSTPL